MNLVINHRALNLDFWRALRDTYSPPWELQDFRNKDSISVSETRARELMAYCRSFPSFDDHVSVKASKIARRLDSVPT